VTGNVTWPWQVEVVTPICWHPLSSIWLEIRVELWLHVTLNFVVIQLHSDRNILWVLQMALDRLRVLLNIILFSICLVTMKSRKSNHQVWLLALRLFIGPLIITYVPIVIRSIENMGSKTIYWLYYITTTKTA